MLIFFIDQYNLYFYLSFMVKGGVSKKSFIKDIYMKEFLRGKNDGFNDIRGIQDRFIEGKCLLVYLEEINSFSCQDFFSEVFVLVVISLCVFWLFSYIFVCLDGRAFIYKLDFFIMGKFLRFYVLGNFCLFVIFCKYFYYGDFLQKNLFESI